MTSMNLEPPDHRERLSIVSDLDTTMLVEAAAGTGKTTILIGRMVALLAEGKGAIENMAAVTFTRKAASELRGRFQIELEKLFRESAGVKRARLAAALSGIDKCFVGTIHSFCGRLLRERPVEARVDVSFQEIDETEDQLLRQTAWDQYVARLYAEHDPILEELEKIGIEIGQLRATFMRFTDYPDVNEWPSGKIEPPDVAHAKQELRVLADHMENLIECLPADSEKDKLIDKYKLIVRMFRQNRTENIAELMEILAEFTDVKNSVKTWPGDKTQAKEEKERWDKFRIDYAEPVLRQWREHRYEPCLRAIKPAVEEYDRLKQKRGKLNYQDLLMFSARLLRDKPRVRTYFRKRVTHLFVDEFQDTDPIQAEVMLLLTASDPNQTDWRACQPVNGSLFVVGDPKQSIYRFRRADIVTYNQVKRIIQSSGGKVIGLSANFRSTCPLIEWINSVFHDKFPAEASDYSPQYVALTAAAGHSESTDFGGVRPLIVSGSGDFREYEADLIARIIRYSLDNRLTLPRSPKDLANGISPEVTPGDFLIITPKKSNLSVYSRKLEELEVPHQVTDSGTLNEINELSLLHTCLVAANEPWNPVSLVAALRSELFGFSDAALYRYKRSGGNFSFLSSIPDGLEAEEAIAFNNAFGKLRKYATWLSKMPVLPAIQNILADTGLAVRAALGAGGNIRAGGLNCALERLRYDQSSVWSVSQAIDLLGDSLTKGEDQAGIPASPVESSVVRVMNLHKVKGLEAPVVFLADPSPLFKDSATSIDLYVERSGNMVRGYLQIQESFEGKRGSRSAIAEPQNWEHYADIELEFLKQEYLRLLYVAATRAGADLIITQRQKGQHFNPWAFFQPRLENLPAVVDPRPEQPPQGDTITVTKDDVSRAEKSILERWNSISSQTYKVSAAKSLALSDKRDHFGTEAGTEWGAAIHTILQLAMTDKDADLLAVARDALAEQNLEVSLAEEAINTAKSVIDSETWKRASSALQVLVEVPFETLWSDDSSNNGPILVRGVIDLAFLEPSGWVIVDYKSDRYGLDRLPELVEHYQEQVLTYARIWEKITNQTVHEVGLYFTYPDEYVKLGRN